MVFLVQEPQSLVVPVPPVLSSALSISMCAGDDTRPSRHPSWTMEHIAPLPCRTRQSLDTALVFNSATNPDDSIIIHGLSCHFETPFTLPTLRRLLKASNYSQDYPKHVWRCNPYPPHLSHRLLLPRSQELSCTIQPQRNQRLKVHHPEPLSLIPNTTCL